MIKKIFGVVLWLVALIAIVLGVLEWYGFHVVERVKYELSGNGVEQWESAAQEAGLSFDAEEYYYDHLPEELRSAYREIFVRLSRNEDAGDFFSKVTADEFWKVYYAVLSDHPEIFWLDTSAQVEESGLTRQVMTYQMDVTVPVEQRDSMRHEIDQAVEACISLIPDQASDYEKIKIVYDYIIDTTEYSANSLDSQNVQSALLYHESVCAGYSKAFQLILHRLGLFCTYLTGTNKDGGDHGWNMVRLDGNYYYVDVTWGDPVFANFAENGGNSRVKNYNYLCCTEYDLFLTHVPGESVELPACVMDDYNYYKRMGFYYETFVYDEIYQALMNSVWADESSIVMKFGSEEAFQEAQKEIFEDGMLKDPGEYLMNTNGVDTWNYRYHTDEKFNLITLYWKS